MRTSIHIGDQHLCNHFVYRLAIYIQPASDASEIDAVLLLESMPSSNIVVDPLAWHTFHTQEYQSLGIHDGSAQHIHRHLITHDVLVSLLCLPQLWP